MGFLFKSALVLMLSFNAAQIFAGDNESGSDISESESDSNYREHLELIRQGLLEDPDSLEQVLAELRAMGLEDYCDLLNELGLSETSKEDKKILEAEKRLKKTKKQKKLNIKNKSKEKDEMHLKRQKKEVPFKGEPNKAQDATAEQLAHYDQMIAVFEGLLTGLGASGARIQRESYAATRLLLEQLRFLHANFRAICEELASGNTRDSRILGRNFPTLHPEYEYAGGQTFDRRANYFFDIVTEAFSFAEANNLLPELARSIETANGCFDDRIRNIAEWLVRERSRVERRTPDPEAQITEWYIQHMDAADNHTSGNIRDYLWALYLSEYPERLGQQEIFMRTIRGFLLLTPTPPPENTNSSMQTPMGSFEFEEQEEIDDQNLGLNSPSAELAYWLVRGGISLTTALANRLSESSEPCSKQ